MKRFWLLSFVVLLNPTLGGADEIAQNGSSLQTVRSIEEYATVEAYVGDVPVYAFGFTYVYGLGPDLLPGVVMQEGNTRQPIKVSPKKSWEIEFNFCGSTPAREPKTMWNDDQPLRPVHLIDGDPETAWSSRGMTAPDAQPEWIRIDLPAESTIAEVALVLSAQGPAQNRKPSRVYRANVGKSLPRQLTVKVSRDGKIWETMYDGPKFSEKESQSTVIRFRPRRAKMVWVIGERLERVADWGPAFSIGELEVRDPEGNNLALVSRGAGVQVSSTYYGYGMDRFTQEMLWPIQYDLGFKWTRVGYDEGMYLWSYVEREKGKLRIDPRADQAITEAHANGVNVIMCLDKGNWLYHDPPRKTDWKRARIYEMMGTYYDHFGWPHESDHLMEGYLRYVDFMVQHFKERVAYFEICNEWPHTIGFDNYRKILLATIPVIKRAAPDARIMLGSVQPGRGPTGYGGVNREAIMSCLRTGEPKVATQIDAIGFHPWYQPDPASPRYRGYRDDVEAFKKECAVLGFEGQFFASEWTYMAPYPVTPVRLDWELKNWTTEMQKAKYSARLMTAHAGMDLVSLYNETFQTGRIERDVTLLRNSSFQVDPITPAQPQPIYYVLRNISTVMDGFRPSEFPVKFSGDREINCYTFRRSSQQPMIAAWIPGKTADGIVEFKSDITLTGVKAKRAWVTDVMNGTEQELTITFQGDDTVLEGMRIKDYPVFVRLEI